MTFALTLALSCVVALLVILFEFGAVPTFVLVMLSIALVKVISKRPEFDGLPAPPPK